MASKTKTIIKETEEVGERDNPAVLAYRVGQSEAAIKDLTTALRESTELHRESSRELATKMDTYASTFATKDDVRASKQDAEKVHQRIDDVLDGHSERFERIERIIQSVPLVTRIVFGMVGMIVVAVFGAIIALVVKGQTG